MAEMIDSFLRLARVTQGELNLEQVNLSSVVTRTFAEIRERDPSREVELVVEDDLYANVDKRFIVMLLSNLLDNAWKYTSQVPRARIEFGRRQVGGQWVYFVADNGAGFDMKYADRLFAPFSRLHKNEEFEGVGIGLATVSRILNRHGGKIWADARPDEGATFYFSLWQRNKDRESDDDTVGGR